MHLHNWFYSCTVIFLPLLVLTLNQWHTHLILYPNLSRFPLHVNVTSYYCNTVSIIYTTDYFMLLNCSMFSTSKDQLEKIYNFSYSKKHTFQTITKLNPCIIKHLFRGFWQRCVIKLMHIIGHFPSTTNLKNLRNFKYAQYFCHQGRKNSFSNVPKWLCCMVSPYDRSRTNFRNILWFYSF
jgi:hypothetical protein